MKQKIFGLITAFVALFVIAACHDKDKEPIPVPDPVVKVEKVTLDSEEISMTVGETKVLKASIVPIDATEKKIEWESSNPSVAKVEDGIVEALAPGTAEIVATCGRESAKCKVEVIPVYIAVETLTIDKEELSMTVGQTETLRASIFPEDATNKEIIWSSSDSSVATVLDGVVKAIKKGTAKITATIGDMSAVCTVFVDKYQYVFGYVYSEDLLKFLTPTITLTLEGQAPIVYTLGDGNHASTQNGIHYGDLSINITTEGSIWWLGFSYNSEQKGSLQINYKRKEVDYNVYDDVDVSSLFNLISQPFVDQSKGSYTLCIHTWTWITIPIGGGLTLKETINDIVRSSSNTVTF